MAPVAEQSPVTPVHAQSLRLSFANGDESVTALDDVSLTVGAGEMLAITGTSGSGKTTLLTVLSGITLPDAGVVSVEGTSISGLSERERAQFRLNRIGVVFQDHNLIPEFTALENTMLPLQAQGMPMQQAREEAFQLLTAVGLTGKEHRRPHELSGGQAQRVGIARALTGKKRLIIADEPTGSLDEQTSLEIFELLGGLAREGVAIIIATHDPAIAEFATSSAVMSDGKLTMRTEAR